MAFVSLTLCQKMVQIGQEFVEKRRWEERRPWLSKWHVYEAQPRAVLHTYTSLLSPLASHIGQNYMSITSVINFPVSVASWCSGMDAVFKLPNSQVRILLRSLRLFYFSFKHMIIIPELLKKAEEIMLRLLKWAIRWSFRWDKMRGN